MSLSKDRSRTYCVRSSVHLGMASTVETQTAEEAKSLSKTESCDRNPVIDLQLPASLNLAVSRNINQFQRLMRGHAWCSKNTYTLVWRSTATFICGGYAIRHADYLQVHIFLRVQLIHCPFQVTGTSRSGPGLNVCWLIKDRLRSGYEAQVPLRLRKWYARSEISCASVLS